MIKDHIETLAALGVLIGGIVIAVAGFYLASSIISNHTIIQRENADLMQKVIEVQGVCRTMSKSK
jgi:hypothetical protein